ncbi:calmin isoform X3 [Cheilinus undulatus]|uniref:calmin isoform X3 n=1 Tax=Cheilinus undulatus TaxID=241271 RepID=UPI001BD1CD68|nr:calmin isoform X3 [Cheilinus undulatus]
MRMQDKVNGEPQERSVGDISGKQNQQSQADEKKAVRCRTFTRWINALLRRCDPVVEVHDLFTDIQDGRILMALLEELSGCKLLYRYRSSSHHIFRLNNISKALIFLDDRHVKLLGIDASSIADGVPSVVLSLIWNIILHFQVKEVTGDLQRRLSTSLSSLSMSGCPSSDLTPQLNDFSSYSCTDLQSKVRRASRKPRYHGKAIKILLRWAQRCTLNFGVEVHDFGRSWRSGLAFLAMIKSINPALVDLRESLARDPKENIQLAFNIAHHSLGIPPLLEPEDVLCSSPDEKSIITYVSMFLVHCSGMEKSNATEVEVPGIPSFGSLESVTFGEIHTDDPEAKALLKGFEMSSEQGLWKRWSRRPSGSSRPDLSSSCGDILSTYHSQDITEHPAGGSLTSTFSRMRGKGKSAFKPPSPLVAGVTSQEIRSWMEKASMGQGYSKPGVDENRFSLSSDEGIYNLSALDSDEEEAYRYILELNKEELQPSQLKRKVPRVEEETAEEMLLNGQPTEESTHVEAHENLKANGCKDIRSKEMENSGAGFDMEPETESRYIERQEGAIEGRSNDFDEDRMKKRTERANLMTRQNDKTQAQHDKTEETNHVEVDKEEKMEEATRDETGSGPNVFNKESSKVEVNQKTLSERPVVEVKGDSTAGFNTEEEISGKDEASTMHDLHSKDDSMEDYSNRVKHLIDFDQVLTEVEEDWELQVNRQRLTHRTAETMVRQCKTSPRNDTNGGVKVHGGDDYRTPAGSATSQSFRGRGLTLESLAASCDVTALELEVLLVLWILLYCYFILP